MENLQSNQINAFLNGVKFENEEQREDVKKSIFLLKETSNVSLEGLIAFTKISAYNKGGVFTKYCKTFTMPEAESDYLKEIGMTKEEYAVSQQETQPTPKEMNKNESPKVEEEDDEPATSKAVLENHELKMRVSFENGMAVVRSNREDVKLAKVIERLNSSYNNTKLDELGNNGIIRILGPNGLHVGDTTILQYNDYLVARRIEKEVKEEVVLKEGQEPKVKMKPIAKGATIETRDCRIGVIVKYPLNSEIHIQSEDGSIFITSKDQIVKVL